MTKSPYINKRKWLDNRKEEITDLYRSGNDWSQITEHLKSVHLMPFTLIKADFFKYCDFLQDEIEYGHFDQNIELKYQLSELKNQNELLDEKLRWCNGKIDSLNNIIREKCEIIIEQNDQVEKLENINEELARDIVVQIKKNEEEKTILSNKIDQYLSDTGVGQAENKKLKERNQLNLDEIKSLKIQRLVLALLLILVIIMHFLL